MDHTIASFSALIRSQELRIMYDRCQMTIGSENSFEKYDTVETK